MSAAIFLPACIAVCSLGLTQACCTHCLPHPVGMWVCRQSKDQRAHGTSLLLSWREPRLRSLAICENQRSGCSHGQRNIWKAPTSRFVTHWWSHRALVAAVAVCRLVGFGTRPRPALVPCGGPGHHRRPSLLIAHPLPQDFHLKV